MGDTEKNKEGLGESGRDGLAEYDCNGHDPDYVFDPSKTHAEEDAERLSQGKRRIPRVIHTGALKIGSDEWVKAMQVAKAFMYEIECLESLVGIPIELKIDTSHAVRENEAERNRIAERTQIRDNRRREMEQMRQWREGSKSADSAGVGA